MKGMTLIVFLIVSDFQTSYGMEHRFTPISHDQDLVFIEDMKNIAGFGDAQHRGPQWYDYNSESEGGDGSDLKSSSEDMSSPSVETSLSSSKSSEASSIETSEIRRSTQNYRTCTPCTHDMMKKYKNFGIKWICGGYQRARRTFKSECMMRYRNCQDGTMDVVLSLIPNVTKLDDINNDLKGVETRRKKRGKKDRSTSSSEGKPRDEDHSSEVDKESLELSSHELSSSTSDEKRKPKSTEERKGWRKWHRKCPPCPEDMAKKWRDPSIEWICGGYQQARRSFKSPCMMYYRNCQDGTMFVKIHDHKCADNTDRGIHFFYDYKVRIDDESSDTEDSDKSMTDESSY